MKRILYFLFLGSAIFYSCEDVINPNLEFTRFPKSFFDAHTTLLSK